jgi:hypothetical protein
VNVEAGEGEIVQGNSSVEQMLADEIRSNLETLVTAIGEIDVRDVTP